MLVIWFGIGALLGWYASKAHTSFGDVKTSARRLEAHLKHRLHNTLRAAAISAIIILIGWVHFHG